MTKETESIIPEWLPEALLVLAILTIIAVAFVVKRKRRSIASETAEVETERVSVVPTAPWGDEVIAEVASPAAPAEAEPVVATPPSEGLLPYLVEEVFVVYKDGRLITSCAREECGTQDADLMSGMLIAIQGLIHDGLENGARSESIKYGRNIMNLATGEFVVLAAVVYGRPDDEFIEALGSVVSIIEGIYPNVVKDWTGETSAMEGIDDLIIPLIQRTEAMTRKDVGDIQLAKGVSILSAVDFHEGFVRLKVGVVNGTMDTIGDSAIEVRYDRTMLRFERGQPDRIKLRGDRVKLGRVAPGEMRTLALLFDPQKCDNTTIDGHLSYFDSKGELQYVQMKRRSVDVVCPDFLTKEKVTTQVLRRLLHDKLHVSDLRVYRYTSKVQPAEVLTVCKKVLGANDIQMVHEFIERSPTFEAEVWYYAETKVKDYKLVLRLGVLEDKRVLELFAASTAMEPITGLMVEFRCELDRYVKDRSKEEIRLELVRHDKLRGDLEKRPLHLDNYDTEGKEGP